jgi:hypothetical protein
MRSNPWLGLRRYGSLRFDRNDATKRIPDERSDIRDFRCFSPGISLRSCGLSASSATISFEHNRVVAPRSTDLPDRLSGQ